MKKFLLIAISTIGTMFAGSVQAQSFATDADTVFVTYSGTDVNVYNKIQNNGGSSVTVNWKVTSTTLPSSWTAVCGSSGSSNCLIGICDNHNCYNNNIPSSPLFGSSAATHTSDPYMGSGAKGDFHLQLVAGLPNLPAMNTYYYLTVNLSVSGGLGTNKDIVFAVKQTSPTGIGNVSKNLEDVELFPNPAHSTLNINYDANAGIRTISVYNLIGKAIGSYRVNGNSGNTSIDISDVPSGVYFVRLMDAQNRVLATRKFTHQ